MYVVSAVVVLAFSACGGCSKEEVPKKAAVKEEKVSLDKSLVELIPDSSFAFLYWKGAHPAYKKLLNSPWSSSGEFSDLMKKNTPQVKQFISMIKALGLDPEDQDIWTKLFSEAVFFAAPGITGDVNTAGEKGDKLDSGSSDGTGDTVAGPASVVPALGVVFSSEGVEFGKALTSLEEQLKTEGREFERISHKGAKGLRVSTGEVAGPKNFYFLSEGSRAVISSQLEAAQRVFDGGATSLPAIAKSPQFKKATKGLPADEIRFVTGYVDLKILTELSKDMAVVDSQGLAELQSKDFAFQSVAIALAMDETPETSLRLLLNPESPGAEFFTVSADSVSTGRGLSVVPKNPLSFFTLNGALLKNIKGLLESKIPADKAAELKKLAFLDSIKQLSLSTRIAKGGVSFFPIPDVLLLLETDAVDLVAAQIEALATEASTASPSMAGMQWTEKKLEGGQELKSLVSPMGFGLFLVKTDGLLIVASTEAQATAALAVTKKDGFASTLSERSRQLVSDSSQVSSFYVDFGEVASLLKKVKGLMAMYAPKNKDEVDALLSAESLENYRKMGALVGSLDKKDEVLLIDSFYQKPSSPS
jgi:hypothetical protein